MAKLPAESALYDDARKRLDLLFRVFKLTFLFLEICAAIVAPVQSKRKRKTCFRSADNNKVGLFPPTLSAQKEEKEERRPFALACGTGTRWQCNNCHTTHKLTKVLSLSLLLGSISHSLLEIRV